MICSFVFSSLSLLIPPDKQTGKSLYKPYCTQCNMVKMEYTKYSSGCQMPPVMRQPVFGFLRPEKMKICTGSV